MTVMLGLIMAIIDSSIVNVALTQMAGNLGASIDEIAWVATGYILANVVVMPLNGWLTALLGRKSSTLVARASSRSRRFLCGTAHIGGRASHLPRASRHRRRRAAADRASDPLRILSAEKRGQAMAIFGMGAMVGPAIGPTLGGYIVDNFSWPLIFYINIPIGIVAFMMTLAYIRDPTYIKKPTRGIDFSAFRRWPPASRPCSTCSSAGSARIGFRQPASAS